MNHALRLLRQALPAAKAARRLARAHGICARQAHRYVALAQTLDTPMPIPEAKAVFSVKLPRVLITRVRRAARRGAIGRWVASALQAALSAKTDHA